MKLQNPEIRFEVTNRCNAQCVMCPREKMTRPQGILDLDLYKRILDEAVGFGAKQVTLENYGESFMDPRIFERARYARAKGLTVYTVSNASLIDGEKCGRLIECFDKIRISMYACTKETYEKVHRGLSFETVEENVARLIAMNKEAPSGKLRIEMYFLLLEENKHEMKRFLEKYEKMVDGISVWKPHNWGNGRGYRETSGVRKSCGRPFTGPVQVQWDGLVVPCCFDYDSTIVLGDLKRQSLYEVLTGQAYEALRNAHRGGDFSKFPFCDGCDQLHKREDVLVYTTLKNIKVGATYAMGFDLERMQQDKAQHKKVRDG